MCKKKIAVYGSSVNPPGDHHTKIVSVLSKIFDKLIIVPCGMRPDKNTTAQIESIHRRAMCKIAFGDIENVDIDFFDIDSEEFTKTIDLISRYNDDGEVWIVVGADIIQGGEKSESEIHRIWKDGVRLWGEANFAVIRRPGYKLNEKDLPPHCEIIEFEVKGSSSEIREMIVSGQMKEIPVSSEVLEYIVDHNLYLENKL